MSEGSDFIRIALEALRDMTLETDVDKREIQAVTAVNAILSDLGGTSMYSVLASSLASFTWAQPDRWKALTVIQFGVLSGWEGLEKDEINRSVKH